jgi:hypothetical protein
MVSGKRPKVAGSSRTRQHENAGGAALVFPDFGIGFEFVGSGWILG